ncbi:bifunctional P-450:NADPH-P450 reductase [Lentinus tigrinus ALCF2SS1-6]|uniref:Bifunctional P-450:NADPH-P450 reductase n=1 Tax=Lentinus tigrinus ALCF2SS1-6 TaxID=1328759 RepID=A0A5C2SC87_9APHY|nr:bifunctional P-450:NADPH-P450 reductase [Lentinus tigrinus ALCF2SS1-6]
MTTPIPSPPALPFLGNLTALEKEVPQRSFELLADQYGEIYKLNLVSRTTYLANSYELQNELSNEKRFTKAVTAALVEVRNGTGDGLFTAHNHEENWGIAHRLLMPAFSTAKVRDMFDDMVDIASQMVTKWERFGPRHVIDVVEDFTRLAFDTITLCAMNFRLNNFYKETPHPFVTAMADFLVESGYRSNRPPIANTLMWGSNAKYQEDLKVMNELVDQLIQDRKDNPIDKEDLLNIMLNGVDKKTGKKLSDENIRHNLITFLVAGHETTSGMLTFTLYYLCKNPEAMRKAREEVDEVLGDEQIRLEHIGKLKYISACFRESLRLTPPATIRVVESVEDTTLCGGKYAVPKGARIGIVASKCQTDPKIWGEDAREFKPERVYGENFEKLPQNAWQPFGYGMRACIGRPFAWQEAHIALACILQKLDMTMHDPGYSLELKQTLTVKPKEFYVHAIPRNRSTSPIAVAPTSTLIGLPKVSKPAEEQTEPETKAEPKHKLYVAYGSNTGTSQTFAQRIASDAPSHGFKATLGTLDSIASHVPTDGPLVIVTASFEGEPADNAAHFFDWIQTLKGHEFADVKYAVFGCGNRDWVRTFQRIPKAIDETFAERGAKRLLERGVGDAQAAEFFEAFDTWEADLWKALATEYNIEVSEDRTPVVSGISMKTVDAGTSRASVLRQGDADLGKVVENRLLTSPNAPAKRHIVFELPEHMTYRAGDYLAILPTNPLRDVHRVTAHFQLSPEQQIVLSSSGPTSLPVDKPISIFALLSGYVELSQPATTRDLRILSSVESSDATKATLADLQAAYAEKVLGKRISILDLLEAHPDIQLPFGTYLEMLPAMRVRQYSISSSPLYDAQRPSLTVSVVEAPALSGKGEAFKFLGVASTFLAGLHPGDVVQLAVRASSAVFHPPEDPTVPMVMFAAGSGLSPMRGFLQERAMQKKAGREVAKSLLFFGCRSPHEDFIYCESDLKEWQELGIVDVRPAFSRSSADSLGCKYVQDRIWHDREEVRDAYDHQKAKFFTCGSGKVAQGVKKVLTELIKEAKGFTAEEAAAAFERAIQGRYATDIFE